MKKKTKNWLIAWGIISGFWIVLFLVIPVLILKTKWWWFWGIGLIIPSTGWLIYLLVIWIKKLKQIIPEAPKINVKGATAYALEWFKNHEHFADNLELDPREGIQTGRYGTDGTPILMIRGTGSEKHQDTILLINLNNYKEEINVHTNLSEEKIEKIKNRLSEHPIQEIPDEIERLDERGRPFERVKKWGLPNSQKERDEINKKQQEEKEAI